MGLFNTVGDSVRDAVADAIRTAIPGAEVEVTTGGSGHYAVRVVSNAFEGLSLVNKQRLVYRAISPFMAGADAPVHAIDRLETLTPTA